MSHSCPTTAMLAAGIYLRCSHWPASWPIKLPDKSGFFLVSILISCFCTGCTAP
ncbi:hypothetical protein [Photorhabdus luminescens]|uniref:hypothetical protein n=1 Tax=Photorhabdus luminescens TaxID=29488 RepID=UPI00223EFC34|nr:hypothetical protein [Photorhabdus luminescens]MCW7763463.1 hypothetical protein [Photorhabdus luminescens subsp. venezuelensis]